MRSTLSIAAGVLLALTTLLHAQTQQQSQPGRPQPLPANPFDHKRPDCKGSFTRDAKSGWKTSSNCGAAPEKTPPPLQAAPDPLTDAAQREKPAPAPAASADSRKPSTADDNPFPEAISRKAEREANAPDTNDGPQPADAQESSSRDRLNGLDLTGEGRQGQVQQSPQLAQQDVHVGEFYLESGDYPGAYARFKEATLADPTNADAVFGLAAAARKLGHLDEAAENYRIYLDAVPSGSKAKAARKALNEMLK